MRKTPKIIDQTLKTCSDTDTILALKKPLNLKLIYEEINKDSDFRLIQCLLTETVKQADLNLKIEVVKCVWIIYFYLLKNIQFIPSLIKFKNILVKFVYLKKQ